MIFRLILKDFKVCGKRIFLRMLPAAMLLAVIFTYRYYSWHVYMMYGYIWISVAINQFAILEKKGLNEVLTCSLPVTRLEVVISKYLTAGLICIIFLGMWYLNGIIASHIYPNAATNFSYALNVKSVFISFVYFSVLISIFMPAIFSFRTAGVIFTFIPAFICAISSVPMLFRPWEISYLPYFEPSDLAGVLLLAAAAVAAISISFYLSTQIYKHKNV